MKWLFLCTSILLLTACSNQTTDPVMASYNNAFSQWQLETDAPENVLTHAYEFFSEEHAFAQRNLPWQQSIQANQLWVHHFQENSTVLSDTEIQQLAALKQKIALELEPSARIIVTGYAHEKGSRAYDLILAWKRAFIVAQYLEHFGVDRDIISLVAMGKAAPKYASRPGMEPLQKSVEITYEKE